MIKQIDLSEIIASRELGYTNEKGNQTLIVTIGKPRPDLNKGGDWECAIQIGETVKLAYGVDSFQALQLAQQLISIELKLIAIKQKINLTWLESTDLGFQTVKH